MEKEEEAGVDKMSDLPDAILHHIFSFLNMEEAVRSSVFSKRWRHLWTSLPTLNFEYDDYNNIPDNKIMGLVDKVLILRDCSHIQRFSLICPEIPNSAVNTWIVSALRRSNLQELVVDTFFVDKLPLPTCLFNTKSLTLLKLVSHSLTNLLTLSITDSSCLPSLKTLFLESIEFVNEDGINNFFSSCPVLESLTIRDCSFDEINIKISSLSLKHLAIEDILLETNLIHSSVTLNTPNLLSFRYKDYMGGRKYYLEDLSSLFKANICMMQADMPPSPDDQVKKKRHMFKFLGACHNVENLTLSATILMVVSGDPDLLGSLTSKFCNLKHLKLKIWLSMDNIHAVTYLLKISPVIESLFLKISKVQLSSTNIGDYLEEELLVDFSLDHLKLIKIRGLVGCAIELNFLEMLLKNAITMEKLVVFTSKEDPSPDRERQLMKFGEKLLEFPRASTSIGILFL